MKAEAKGIQWEGNRMWWEKPSNRMEKYDRILACLREDARMSLAEISRRTKIPTSTVYDALRVIRDRFWFTAVFLDRKAEETRERVTSHPTGRHPHLLEVVA